ncbi:MAG: ferrous iron transport protein B [Desulfomonile sp.]|nr:ferrous iron transport protein B [Desulfomonile sp.]
MSEKITIALAGNPNAGKTTIFNAITGARQHVGNWPGVTVEKKEGSVRIGDYDVNVVDLPGTYSLTALSVEEIIARNFLLESGADVVIDVVDASNLERNLYLAVQLMEMGVKLVLALNMIDVARGRNIHINERSLSDLLGIPVVATNGKKGVGIQDLLDSALRVALTGEGGAGQQRVRYGTEMEEEIAKVEAVLSTARPDANSVSRRWFAMKLLEGDPEVAGLLEAAASTEKVFQQVEASRAHLVGVFGDPPEIVLADARYGFISGLVKRSVRMEASDRVYLSEKIDKVLTNRLLGPIILILVLYGVYAFTFQGSEWLVKAFESFFGWLGDAARAAIPEGLIQSLIVSGIIDGVGGVLGFVPLIAFMFFAIAILEDTGYMARIAFMLDRVLRGFGLHGASMLALLVAGGLAGGCAVPGIMATRTLREPKERLATILVIPLMNCGAKLPVYAMLIAAFFAGNKAGLMLLLTLISWVMVLTAGKIIRSTVLAGPSAPFVLELPPYRVPTLRGLLIHTWERTWMYIKKAGTVILAISVLIWACMTFPALPEEKAKEYEQKTATLTERFLAEPEVSGYFKSEKDINKFVEFRTKLREGRSDELRKESPAFFKLAEVLAAEGGAPSAKDKDPQVAAVAEMYDRYDKERESIEHEKQTAQLRHSIGGRLGMALEVVTRPLNFDWRTNVALVGGFAAKEVVVSTLGTAYSLGKVQTEEATGLSERLSQEPGWNKLTAFTLILFVMFYAPCFVTLVVMRKETGTWKWPAFATLYTTTLAYIVALVVHTAGSLLGLGLS